MATTGSTNTSVKVLDDAGLDILLAAISAKLQEKYVDKDSFESSVQEIIDNSNIGTGLTAFAIEDGHLIAYYEGDTAPNVYIEDGHLIYEMASSDAA